MVAFYRLDTLGSARSLLGAVSLRIKQHSVVLCLLQRITEFMPSRATGAEIDARQGKASEKAEGIVIYFEALESML